MTSEEADKGARAGRLPSSKREGERGDIREDIIICDGDTGGVDGGMGEEAGVEVHRGGAAEHDARREPIAEEEAVQGGGVALEYDHYKD